MNNSYEIKDELSDTVDYISVFVERASELTTKDTHAIIKHLRDVADTVEELSCEDGDDE